MTNHLSKLLEGERTPEQLASIITDLTACYDLRIPVPDPTLSPRKKRLNTTTEEQEQNHILNQSLHFLYHKGELLLCLERFESEAGRVCQGWIPKPDDDLGILAPACSVPLGGARTAHERATLRQRLQEILADARSALTSTPSKRANVGASEGVSGRRTRTRLNEDPRAQEACSLIDEVPVRSSQLAERTDTGPALDLASTPSSQLPPRHPLLTSSTANSSRASLNLPSFLTSGIGEATEQNTPNSSLSATEELTEELPLRKLAIHTPNQSPPQYDDAVFGQTHEVRAAIDKAPYTTIENESRADVSGLGAGHQVGTTPVSDYADRSLLGRLQTIWPVSSFGLNKAPLPVIWEVTRAAIHCGVDLRDLDLEYEPGESGCWWHDQDRLWEVLSRHPSFHGKPLPPKSQPKAWEAALFGFRQGCMSVLLSAEIALDEGDAHPTLLLKLYPLELLLGHRLDRRFGADRFLEVTMPQPSAMAKSEKADEKETGDQVTKWLCHGQHFFLGRKWAPFFTRGIKRFVKDTRGTQKKGDAFLEKVYFFATNGNLFRPGNFPSPDEATDPRVRTTLSCGALLESMIGLSASAQQPVTKLFSRIALGLSRTYPTEVLEEHQIRHRDTDILSTPTEGKAPSVMNDGISRISPGLARKIADKLGLTYLPCAFQARLGSAKGMWLIDGDSSGDEVWIETHPSQRKFECNFQDLHHRTFEVRDWPKQKLGPALLNQQLIPILECQADRPREMRDTIAGHLVATLRKKLDTQTASLDHPQDCLAWMQQEGMFSSQQDHSDMPDDEIPFLGGLPDKSADKIEYLLQSGFDLKLPLLRREIQSLRQDKMALVMSKHKIEVPCSTYAFMVVDFHGVLQPDEVHVSFSTDFTVDGFSETLLEGMDILVARVPAHFPGDIQRVRVVSRPELRKLKNVIVFPTTGHHPLADLLSGGDYDGDKAWICWDQKIVRNFRNASPRPEYDFLREGYLRKQTTTFLDLKTTHQDDPDGDAACNAFLYMGLSFSMGPKNLGLCTRYKDRLCYMGHAIDSKEVLLLSVLLSNLVDQAKSGIIFTKDDWQRVISQVLKQPTYLPDPEYTKDKLSDDFINTPASELHILDYLKFIVADEEIRRANKEFDENFGSEAQSKGDFHLTSVANEFLEMHHRSPIFEPLSSQIVALAAEYSAAMASYESSQKYKDAINRIYLKWIGIPPPPEVRHSAALTQLWAQSPWVKDMTNAPEDAKWSAPFGPWNLLKASMTFKNLYARNEKFIWNVAGRQLAFIKAAVLSSSANLAHTSPVFMVPHMAAVMKPNTKKILALSAQRKQAAGADSMSMLEGVMDFDDEGTVIDDA